MKTLITHNRREIMSLNWKEITVKYRGFEVACYGKLHDEENILLGSSYDEEVIENFNYETGEAFSNWTEVVKYLIDVDGYTDIEQLEVC